MAALPLLAVAATLLGQAPAIAIRDVTVFPATGAGPIPGATVVVEGGRIGSVGPVGRVAIPAGARVIDGRGRFLIPGLFEMHAHVSKARASSLGLFVANGVTTVRDLGGDHQEALGWRREIRNGERVGPRLLLAGPYLESATNARRQHTTPVEEMVEPTERTRVGVGSPEDARRIVDSLARLELDYLKIRTVQNEETYRALVAAAHAHGLDLVGHAGGPPEVVIEAGQRSVEHGFLPSRDSTTAEARRALWHRLAAAGIAVVPTMVTVPHSVFPPTDSLRAMVEDSLARIEPRRKYLSRFLGLDWREQVLELDDQRRSFFRGIWPAALRNLREMKEAGVLLLPGSDVAVLNIWPGFTLHDELALFVDSLRFTPAEALIAGTRQSAEFLGHADSVGTIEAGKAADLVLLDADPLADIRNTRRIRAVIVRGRLYDRAALDQVLVDVTEAPDRRVNDWPRRQGETRPD